MKWARRGSEARPSVMSRWFSLIYKFINCRLIVLTILRGGHDVDHMEQV